MHPRPLRYATWVGNSYNGAVGELIFHNRYSYANGNPVNLVDPSGMIGERPEQFTDCIGDEDSSRGKPCCGPDATKWIYNEVGRHMVYATQEWGISRSLSLVSGDIWRLMAYGLAVDYSNINYRQLAGNLPEEAYSCQGARKAQYISVCNVCHHASDFGNFILGAAIHAAGYPRFIAEQAGERFKALSGDPTSGPDVAGTGIGWDFAAGGGYNYLFDLDSFCASLNQMGTSWFDRSRSDCGCIEELGGRPCGRYGPSLDFASQTEANWNKYVSDLTGSTHEGKSPQDELIEKLPSLIGSIFS